ncbi:TPA: hypothetical protein NR299_003216, partial [Legionella pneumophila]|nr:hypothetical protein [Legionella pneumophila]
MIDYEKLKKAHELAGKITIDSGKRADVYVSIYDGDKIVFGIMYDRTTYESIDIDHLLNKIEELTQPKPKYEVGDEIWFINSANKISSLVIERIDYQHPDGFYYVDKHGNYKSDKSTTFSSLELLIDSQIEYWKNLRTPEESKLCPKCGNKRVADGMCWQPMCDYLEEPVPIDKMSPPFEGEVKGFRCFDDGLEARECEHEYAPSGGGGGSIPYSETKNCIKCGDPKTFIITQSNECSHNWIGSK